MSIKVAIVALCIFGGTLVSAQTIDEINAQYAEKYKALGLAQGKAQTNFLAAQDQVKALQKSVEDLNKQSDQATTDDNSAKTYGFFGAAGGANYNKEKHDKAKALQAQASQEQQKLNIAQLNLDNAEAQFEDAKNQYFSTNDQKNADVSNLQAKYQALDKELTSASLGKKIGDLKNKLNNTQQTLNVMETKYDNAMLGAYLQRKMGEVLNSKALCTSIASCSAKGKGSATAADLKEIFGKMTDEKYGGNSGSSWSAK